MPKTSVHTFTPHSRYKANKINRIACLRIAVIALNSSTGFEPVFLHSMCRSIAYILSLMKLYLLYASGPNQLDEPSDIMLAVWDSNPHFPQFRYSVNCRRPSASFLAYSTFYSENSTYIEDY